jgi:hypothetical protein
MNDHLCVRIGAELVAASLKFTSNFLKVVDLAVVGYPVGDVLVAHRLMPSGGEVNNREAPAS